MESIAGISGQNNRVNDPQEMLLDQLKNQEKLHALMVRDGVETKLSTLQQVNAMKELGKSFQDVLSSLKTVGDKVRQS